MSRRASLARPASMHCVTLAVCELGLAISVTMRRVTYRCNRLDAMVVMDFWQDRHRTEELMQCLAMNLPIFDLDGGRGEPTHIAVHAAGIKI